MPALRSLRVGSAVKYLTLDEACDEGRIAVEVEAPRAFVHAWGGIYEAAPVLLYTIPSAIVHGDRTIALDDETIIDDPDVPAMRTSVAHAPANSALRRAVYGARPHFANYYHFVFNTIVQCFGLEWTMTLLPLAMPAFGEQWMEALRLPGWHLDQNEARVVPELLIRSDCGGSHGATPMHPFIAQLRARLRKRHTHRATRIYLSRRLDAVARPMTNELALERALLERGIMPVTLSKLSVDDQLDIVGRAELIVAPHGAGLTNLIAARPGARVLEIRPSHCNGVHFERLSAVLDLSYSAVIAPTGASAPDAPWEAPVPAVLAAL